MKRQLFIALMAAGLIAFTATGVSNLRHTDHKVKLDTIKLQDSSNQLKLEQLKSQQLNQKLDKALHNKDTTQQQVQELQQELQQSQQHERELEGQLQARAAQKAQDAQRAQQVATSIPGTATASAAGACGDNSYAAYIYSHESGCRTTAMNSGGCYGLGQDCNGIVYNRCGADYACQNAYFTDYANRRYGGWQGAYNFWVANHWW